MSRSLAFNVPGVKEHAHFLKDISNARAIRSRILECEKAVQQQISRLNEFILGFEQANQPTMSDIERRNLLHFCIVGEAIERFVSTPALMNFSGGGPTGVEFAAELHDLLNTDIKRHFPGLQNLARISLFDVAPTILGSFDEGLQEYVIPFYPISILIQC